MKGTQFVGGLLIQKVQLLPSEELILHNDATHRWPRWMWGHGTLFLTNKRLIFCPNRLEFFRKPFAIELSSIKEAKASSGIGAAFDYPSRIEVHTGDQVHRFGFGLYGWRRRPDWVKAIQQASTRLREGGP